jgi:hypothetical protein
MKRLLIKYKDNWADEMDVYGFHIMSEKAWNFFLSILDNNSEHFDDGDFSIGVGSNEEIHYKSKEDLLSAFEVVKVTDTTEATIRLNFKLPYGQFPIEQIAELIMPEYHDHEEGGEVQWFFEQL